MYVSYVHPSSEESFSHPAVCREVSTALVSPASRGSGGPGKRSKEDPSPRPLHSRCASTQVSGDQLGLKLDM